MIVNRLVDEKLILLEGENSRVDVSKEVDGVLQNLFDSAGGRDAYLARTNADLTKLREYWEKKMRLQKMFRLMTGGRVVTDGEDGFVIEAC